MRTDFHKIEDGASVVLHPLPDNPLHDAPVKAMYSSGYFYCEGSNPADGPDYYLGDVLRFCLGFEAAP